MKLSVVAFVAICLSLIVAACVAGERHLPTGEPYLTGTITSVGGEPLTVRIEEFPGGLDTGGAKAVARITNRTRVTRDGNLLAPSELRMGQRASLWFEGPVAESFPVQGEAAVISVLSSG